MNSQNTFTARKSGFQQIDSASISQIPSIGHSYYTSADRSRAPRYAPVVQQNRVNNEFWTPPLKPVKSHHPIQSVPEKRKSLQKLTSFSEFHKIETLKQDLQSMQSKHDSDQSQFLPLRSTNSLRSGQLIKRLSSNEMTGQPRMSSVNSDLNLLPSFSQHASKPLKNLMNDTNIQRVQSSIQLIPITHLQNTAKLAPHHVKSISLVAPQVIPISTALLPSIKSKPNLPKGFFFDEKGYKKEFHIEFSIKTRAGQYSPNLRKENQDASISIPAFPTDRNSSLFGICDGHGEYGHLVSNFTKKSLPKAFIKEIKQQGGWKSTDLNLQQILTKSFQQVSNELLASNIDTFMSGTTAVTVLIRDNVLWCSNCGDSRALLGREIGRQGKSEWKSLQLSEDHKPDLIREKKRILEHGGRVERSTDENGNPDGIFRVWDQSMAAPGLAMSRSLGDKSAREVGVISDPEIFEVILKEEDKFIVIASDGVWEFLSNAEVVKIVIPFLRENDVNGAAEAIIKNSLAAWQKNNQNSIDDITCVVLFFKILDEPKKKVVQEYV